MRVLVGAIAVLLAAGSLGTVSESQRYVPFTLVAGGTQTIDMNERHPSHG